MFTKFDKALVAPAVGIIVVILSLFGFTVHVPQEQVVAAIMAVVGVLTYVVPNKE